MELRRRGWTVNRKRVYRILRRDNLLCMRPRKFVVTTEFQDAYFVLNDLVSVFIDILLLALCAMYQKMSDQVVARALHSTAECGNQSGFTRMCNRKTFDY